MENQNKNSLVIIILCIVIVILTVLCILLATNKIGSNSNNGNNNKETVDNNTSKQNQNNESNNIDNSKREFTKISKLNVWEISQKEYEDVVVNNKTVRIKVEDDNSMAKINLNDKELTPGYFDFVYVTDYFILLSYGQGRSIAMAFDENGKEIKIINNNNISFDTLYVKNGKLYGEVFESSNNIVVSCFNCSPDYQFIYDGENIVIEKI